VPGGVPSVPVALRAACLLPSAACVEVGRGQTPPKHPNPGQTPQAADG